MNTLQKFMTGLLGWFLALLKVLVALFILAIAKVLLRTNPELAIAVLASALIMFLGWYFAPQIKQFFK